MIGALAASAQAASLYHVSFGGQGLANFDVATGGAENVTTTYAGVSVDGIAGDDTFNDIGQSFNATLIQDSTGSSAAGVTAQIGGWRGINPADAGGAGHAFGADVPDALMTGLTWGPNPGTQTITIANLDPTMTYKVEWFSALSNVSLDNNVAVQGGTPVDYNIMTNHGNGNVITFDNVALGTYFDEFGNQRDNAIQITPGGANAVAQYVRITAIPEPSSALFGLAGLALFLRRRK